MDRIHHEMGIPLHLLLKSDGDAASCYLFMVAVHDALRTNPFTLSKATQAINLSCHAHTQFYRLII